MNLAPDCGEERLLGRLPEHDAAGLTREVPSTRHHFVRLEIETFLVENRDRLRWHIHGAQAIAKRENEQRKVALGNGLPVQMPKGQRRPSAFSRHAIPA